MEQAGRADLADHRFVETQFAAERDHQRAHRDRVHVGVVVLGLQAGQADQRAGVAHDRIGDLLDQRRGGFGIDCLAHARLLEHRGHRLAGRGADAGGARQFCRGFDFRRRLGGSGLDKQVRAVRGGASTGAIAFGGATSSPFAVSIHTSRTPDSTIRRRSFGSSSLKAVRQNGWSIHEPQSSCRNMPRRNWVTEIRFSIGSVKVCEIVGILKYRHRSRF